MEDLIAYGVLGVILGGRIGYMLFYSADRWMADPTLLLRIWEGGMSFHGGLLGVTAVIFLYSRANKIKFLSLADFVAPLVPAGLFFGRLGNFVNQELWPSNRCILGNDISRRPIEVASSSLTAL